MNAILYIMYIILLGSRVVTKSVCGPSSVVLITCTQTMDLDLIVTYNNIVNDDVMGETLKY